MNGPEIKATFIKSWVKYDPTDFVVPHRKLIEAKGAMDNIVIPEVKATYRHLFDALEFYQGSHKVFILGFPVGQMLSSNIELHENNEDAPFPPEFDDMWVQVRRDAMFIFESDAPLRLPHPRMTFCCPYKDNHHCIVLQQEEDERVNIGYIGMYKTGFNLMATPLRIRGEDLKRMATQPDGFRIEIDEADRASLLTFAYDKGKFITIGAVEDVDPVLLSLIIRTAVFCWSYHIAAMRAGTVFRNSHASNNEKRVAKQEYGEHPESIHTVIKLKLRPQEVIEVTPASIEVEKMLRKEVRGHERSGHYRRYKSGRVIFIEKMNVKGGPAAGSTQTHVIE